MGLGYHLEINRRYGSHEGPTEWEINTRSLPERMRKAFSMGDPRLVAFHDHYDTGGSTGFCIRQGVGDEFAFGLFRALTAWDEEDFEAWITKHLGVPTPVEEPPAPQPDEAWMRSLVESHTDWHHGKIEEVDDIEEGEYHPDNNPEVPKYQLEILADQMSGEILTVFMNRDRKPLYVWVCYGGEADAVEPAKAAAALAQRIATDEDGFGYTADCFHPSIRDLVWEELSLYTRSWSDW